MPIIKILSRPEIDNFNSPPHFSAREHEKYFYIDQKSKSYLETIRDAKNKIGFLAQYGYFKASGKFFSPKDFVGQDIKYLSNKLALNCNLDEVRFYKKSQANVHKHQILEMTGWSKFDKTASSLLTREACLLATRQHRPRIIFNWLLSFLLSKKIEVPAYYPLAKLVTKALSENESILIDIVGKNLEPSHRIVLDHLVETYDDDSLALSLMPASGPFIAQKNEHG